MKNVIFFGSDKYSTVVLSTLLYAKNIKIVAIITTPKKPVGRRYELVANEVEKLAIARDIKVYYYPPNLDEMSKLINNDTIGVSASFGRIISSDILHLFPHGIYNLHPSLLPQYRNVAPVPYAIALGDSITGITVFQMDEKIDKGKNLIQIEEKILPSDTSPVLLKRLFQKGSDSLINWLTGTPTSLPAGRGTLITQSSLIFTRKLTRESGFIEWSLFQKYLSNDIFTINDTQNPLLTLRLTHHPDRNNTITAVRDLYRALSGWEKIWTKAPTKNKELEVFITSLDPVMIQIPGKPKPILYSDFAKYYL